MLVAFVNTLHRKSSSWLAAITSAKRLPMGNKQTAFVVVFVVCWAIVGTPASTSTGEDIVFKSTDRGPANFSFPLPAKFSLVIIVNSSIEEVFHLDDKGNYGISSYYKARIDRIELKNGMIMFSLKNVKPEDAGNYSCREGHTTGSEILNCGQRLQYVDEGKNASEGTTSQPDHETATGGTLATNDTGTTVSPEEVQSSDNGGTIAGAVVGSVVPVIALIVIIVVLWMKRKKASPASKEPQRPDAKEKGSEEENAHMLREVSDAANPGGDSPQAKQEESSGTFPRSDRNGADRDGTDSDETARDRTAQPDTETSDGEEGEDRKSSDVTGAKEDRRGTGAERKLS